MSISADDYYAQATVRNIGIVSAAEQEKLRNARVAIVGMGGGGGIYLATLTRMGVGRFNVADFDTFSLANINRQYGAMNSTIGRRKTEVMAEIARDIHPGVQINEFGDGIGPHNIDAFLDEVDVVVDALDLFAQPARLLLYQAARKKRIPVLTGAVLGLSATVGGFAPDGMTFESYFDITEDMEPFEILARFVVGLAPRGRHWSYMDSSRVAPEDQTGPSSAAAIALLAGMVCPEVLVAILNRRSLNVAPNYTQYDPYLKRFWTGKLRWGNRGPLQRLKLWLIARRFAARKDVFNRVSFQHMPDGTTDTTRRPKP